LQHIEKFGPVLERTAVIVRVITARVVGVASLGKVGPEAHDLLAQSLNNSSQFNSILFSSIQFNIIQ
jgi:hypothetical protein